MSFEIRTATMADAKEIEHLITLSSRILGVKFYSEQQIEGALKAAWGLDSQLIQDKTYFVVELKELTQLKLEHAPFLVGKIVGCGGWSYRETLFGNNVEKNRDSHVIDPKVGAAKIRAFFVHPELTRQGIANLIMAQCEQAAIEYGFQELELMSTLPGMQFYTRHQFVAGESISYSLNEDLNIEFVPMKKSLMNTSE